MKFCKSLSPLSSLSLSSLRLPHLPPLFFAYRMTSSLSSFSSPSSPSSLPPRPSSDPWLSSEYSNFAAHRTRPGIELLERVKFLLNFTPNFPISPEEIKRAIDFGCGNGRFLPFLFNFLPHLQHVTAVDSSSNMIENGKSSIEKDFSSVSALFKNPSIAADWKKIQWEIVDGTQMKLGVDEEGKDIQTDFFFSNAALHWFPSHETLFPSLFNRLVKPGGLIAIQIPNNFNEKTHTLAKDTYMAMHTEGKVSSEVLSELQMKLAKVLPPSSYGALLRENSKFLDIWETAYEHTLTEKKHKEKTDIPQHPFLTWISGSFLGPLLSILPSPLHKEFLFRYSTALHSAYPIWEATDEKGEGVIGCVIKFRRIFIVAVNKDGK